MKAEQAADTSGARHGTKGQDKKKRFSLSKFAGKGFQSQKKKKGTPGI
jgi:hypothetical protein